MSSRHRSCIAGGGAAATDGKGVSGIFVGSTVQEPADELSMDACIEAYELLHAALIAMPGTVEIRNDSEMQEALDALMRLVR